MRRVVFLLGLCTVLVSCSGYRLRQKDNPLAQYGIQSVSIPMFLNRTGLPRVSGSFTREMIALMSGFKDLKVSSGDSVKNNAVLLGTVFSAEKSEELNATVTRVFTDSYDDVKSSIGNRFPFYLPRRSKVSFNVHLVLIKNPTRNEIDLARSSLGKQLVKGPKIIFNEVMAVSGAYTRELRGNVSSGNNSREDMGGVVNYTQNKASLERSVLEMAKASAESFRGTILYAF
jgi:hypothetical protein